MDYTIKEAAGRLKGLRELEGYSVLEVSSRIGVDEAEYAAVENGEKDDFSVNFLYKCAEFFGVDIIEILTGDNPKLNKYSVVRKNAGLKIERRAGFDYRHLAYMFKNKETEPLFVTIPYVKELEDKPILLSSHAGQEFDYILKGTMKLIIGDSVEILEEGDSVYYDSGNPHGMIATGGEECQLLAVLVHRK